ncbi:helix-turn-helix transcriptional regulator [Rhizobium sp. KVB221]|uniref:Helix-turn-helix transcriptional regulator n=1 Tax=Rhizobium setariae TaxID=2801340 RepID=A0A936YSZ1_9HYPH|nr:metalloregulator ArsR/SmtB family transcription factor [Rhizobium setariae]MBL0372376.1 helix-turn-helix transcriptional regulator [Rhizobium setariae]
MEERQALGAFGALSQETRLQVIRLLVVAGPEGMASGQIGERLEVSPSNVSFHLKELERAGLVTMERESRSIIYRADYAALGALVRFLMEDCCGGHPEICAPVGASNVCCSPALKEKMR